MEPLFRKEVLKRRSSRLHGEINLATPISWQVIGFSLIIALVASLLFLFSMEYARVETVSGLVVPDKGLSVAVPTRTGVLSRLQVSEGQKVAKGDILAQIIVAETLEAGKTATEQAESSLFGQQRSATNQASALLAASRAERARLLAQIGGVEAELRSVSEQIAVQGSLVSSAQKDLDQATAVAERGFISRRDLLYREEQLAIRTQQLAQFSASQSSKIAQIEELRRSTAQADAQALAEQEGFAVMSEEVARQQINVAQAGGYVLPASTSGMVTAIGAKVGQVVNTATPLLSIIPDGSKMRAELLIPPSMIGFIVRGQEVNLAIDAFPYQQFGTMKGRVEVVPHAAITRLDEQGRVLSSYLVIVNITKPFVMAFGKSQQLRPGMTLTARIVTRRQSLLEWLFEPLYAVSRR